MHILIIEDEAMVARRIQRLTKALLGGQIKKLTHCESLLDGRTYISENDIDLLLLDLNLNGEDGFDVLKNVVAQSFQTIIISAYKEKAIEAFEYGVLDFVPKPFNEKRLGQAFERMYKKENAGEVMLKYLAIQKKGNQVLIDISNIMYIKGARVYTEVFLKNGKREVHNKTLDSLEQLLPASYERIHKSYLVDMHQVKAMNIASGGKYKLILMDDEQLPVSRNKYKMLKEKWFV